jgi:hypothetical protein
MQSVVEIARRSALAGHRRLDFERWPHARGHERVPLPEDGKIVVFNPRSPSAQEIASGAPLLVDVELTRGVRLFGLSQGTFTVGNPEGSPADPFTGSLVEVKPNGDLDVIVDQLDRPTSLEFINDTAFVVTFGGEIYKIANAVQ